MLLKEFSSLSEADIQKLSKNILLKDFLRRFGLCWFHEFQTLTNEQKTICVNTFVSIRKSIDKKLDMIVSEIPIFW